jgi:hypothetical protein
VHFTHEQPPRHGSNSVGATRGRQSGEGSNWISSTTPICASSAVNRSLSVTPSFENEAEQHEIEVAVDRFHPGTYSSGTLQIAFS